MDKTCLYLEKINRVIDHIDTHLTSSLSLDELSQIACLSPFHFHRIFHAFTQETLYAFITRLRVERGAGLLINTPYSITEIALQCGFNDGATFARAFKKCFASTASAYRKTHLQKTQSQKMQQNSKNHQALMSNIGYIAKDSLTTSYDVNLVSVVQQNYDMRTIAYVRHTGTYAGDSGLFATLHQRLLMWAKVQHVPDWENRDIVAIYHDPYGITADEKLRLSLGMCVPDELQTHRSNGNLQVGRLQLLAGNYLVCHYKLYNDEYAQAWQQVYAQLLPTLGLLPADGYCFECYSPDCYNEQTKTTSVAICVPVT